ncbi:MAG: hypothetical protein KDB11_30525 [Planctomycetales bacterium]|nr:hypothetical protein [Planctomycetales bacterium]
MLITVILSAWYPSDIITNAAFPKVAMRYAFACVIVFVFGLPLLAQTKTWDGKYETGNIDVKIVYFVPSDRTPLPDWRERIDYYRRRIELFHAREFQGQSTLSTIVCAEPLISEANTSQLRRGDADAIFFRTLAEAERRLGFGQGEQSGYPILLVLSDINWRPLEDFYRLRSENGSLVFEGMVSQQGQHFPGAKSGGARATYFANRGVGWGLVSADGWRVPYRGSDCVIYHEGCGHTVGLPHPNPGNGSVMSGAQYLGWISESWLDKEQKSRLGWMPRETEVDEETELFTHFRAIPEPAVPKPREEARLALDWPSDVRVKSIRVRFQTGIENPWVEVPQAWAGDAPASVSLGAFDRATPVSYRIDAELDNGTTAELWGYFQVRTTPGENPLPLMLSPDLIPPNASPSELEVVAELPSDEVDLLAMATPAECWTRGDWATEAGKLVSPKQFGARIELPYSPPEEYRLKLVIEPLDPPNGLLIGQLAGGNRFAVLVNFDRDDQARSALENIDGRNVGNDSTFIGRLFKQNRLSQVIVTVRKQLITVAVDGAPVISWSGEATRLSLSDYWKTPNENALFLGAYDCRYRFHRVTLEPITGEGRNLKYRD